MTTMEGIIRPFQTQTPGVRVTSFNQVGVPTVRLIVGAGGSGVTTGGSYSLEITFYQDKAINELSLPDQISEEMRVWALHALDQGGKI